MSQITTDSIKQYLSQFGWELISTSYKNLDTELIFKCNEGHEVYSTWKKIRSKCECPVCKQNIFKDQKNEIIPKKKNETRIIALDQQTHLTGYSVFSNGKLIKFGVFRASHNDEIARDNAIKNWLLSMINNWSPQCVALEGIQLQETSTSGETKKMMGVTVFETLARLQGILMEACYEAKVDCIICPTNTWRAHSKLKGRTRSDRKRSAQLLIKELYDVTVGDDEADSILIGKYAADTYIPINSLKTENWET